MADTPETKAPKGFPEGFDAKIREARMYRRGDAAVWDLCFAFLRNEQYIGWGANRLSIVSLLPQVGQNATITNILQEHDRTFQFALKTTMPKVLALPQSVSTEDLRKSLATSQAGYYLWHDNKMPRVFAKNARILSAAGTAATWTWWNAKRKKVCTESVSAYDLLFEPYATSWEESAWRAVRKYHKREELVESYPKSKTYLNDQPSIADNEDKGREKLPEDRLELWHVYWNDGRYGVLCGAEWLWTGRTPEDVMPVVPHRCVIIEGMALGLPLLFFLLDSQRSYNKIKNFVLDMIDATSNAPWMVPTTAHVNKAQLRNDPKAIVDYNPVGGKPSRESPINVPAGLFEQQNRIKAEAQDASGLHPASFGRKPSGYQSGVALQELKDGDLAQLNGPMGEMEECAAETMKVQLVYWKHYIDEPTAIVMLDATEGRIVSRTIAQTDFLEHPEVIIEPGTMFAITAQGRDDELKDLFAQGAITPEELKKEITLQIDRRDAVKKMRGLDRATEFLEMAKQGIEIEIFPYDDLESIREVFEEYVNSPEYNEEALSAKVDYEAYPSDETATAFANAVGIHDYLREILVAVQAPANMSKEEIRQIASMRIFPRPDTPPGPPPQQQGQPGPQQGPRQLPKPQGPPMQPGPAPAGQRPPGAMPRGNPLQSSASNVAGGIAG